MAATSRSSAHALSRSGPERCRRKFLAAFPGGFRDETYLDWERDYKVAAHKEWVAALSEAEMRALLEAGEHQEIAARAARVEQRARHPMIFSYEKMALRDAIRTPAGARTFAEGLFAFLHGDGSDRERFEGWRDAVASLPRPGTRVLTWPLLTVFGFLAQPKRHMFVKPNTMRRAAREYGFDLHYSSKPDWETYASVLKLARAVKRDLRDLRPRDMIDVQSFLWVQGSDEY